MIRAGALACRSACTRRPGGRAQTYPSKQITLTFRSCPESNDLVAAPSAKKLAEAWGQPPSWSKTAAARAA